MTTLPIPSDDSALQLLGGMPSIEAVRELESLIMTLPQADIQTTNVIHGGMCARTILIPAGVVLTGALTNCDNVCIASGDITVTTDEGAQRLTGYHVIPAKSGAKRAGIAHSDTYWTTIWPTQLLDIESIEDEFTDESNLLMTRRDKESLCLE